MTQGILVLSIGKDTLLVQIQIQMAGGIWHTILNVEGSNDVAVKMRLDEAQRTYNTRCRARDPRSGTIIDYRG